jgi:hypothetical protein
MIIELLSRVALAISLACLVSTASACSCGPAGNEYGQFLHDRAPRLPANAKGALFLAPFPKVGYIKYFFEDDVAIVSKPQIRLDASDFEVRDGRGNRLPARVTPVGLRADDELPENLRGHYYVFSSAKAERAFIKGGKKLGLATLLSQGKLQDVSSLLADERRLFLVGPVGGFRPGETYTIMRVAPGSDEPRATVVHEIAREEVDLGEPVRLVLNGAPSRRMVAYASGRGSCTASELKLVQDFHFEVPPSLKPYQDALTFLSEIESEKLPGRFESTVIQATICSSPKFGVTATADLNDFAVASCSNAPASLTLRGWVGFPEVDGKLRLVDTRQVPFGSVKGSACTAQAMLNESLQAEDYDNAAYAACQLWADSSNDITNGERKLPPFALVEKLLHDRPETKACASSMLGIYVEQQSGQEEKAISVFAETVQQYFEDPETLRKGLNAYDEMILLTRDNDALSGMLMERMERMVPKISAILDGLRPDAASDAISTTSRMGRRGRLLAPALKKHLVPGSIHASAAIEAMENIAPDDPELPGLLFHFQPDDPAYRDAIVSYSRIAKTWDSKEMLQKLIPFVNEDDYKAAREVANYKMSLLIEAAPAIRPDGMATVLKVLVLEPQDGARRKQLRAMINASAVPKRRQNELLRWLATQP